MRALRILIVAAVVIGSVFLVADPASAQISTQVSVGSPHLVADPASAQISTQVSVGSPHLVAKGAQLDVPLAVVCDPSLNIAFGDASVSQVSGHKLAQGTGSFFNDFPGVPCTGSPQVVQITVSSLTSFAFKQGHATLSADFNTFDPVAGVLTTTTIGPFDVRIIK